MTDDVLHEDDPTRPGNLTAEEYEATYADGGGHELPPGLAEAIAAELDRGGPRGLFTLPYVPAYAHGGAFTIPPNIVVVHAAECPIRAGFARSLAAWFARSPADGGPGTSAHTFSDPAEVVEMVHAETIAYHVGPAGNPVSRGEENAGYTSYTREQWTTPDGLAMLRMSAYNVAQRCAQAGVPVRWLSIAQVAQAARTHRPEDGGICTHNDIRLALGGTTHTDPGAGYPYDIYLDMIRELEDDVSYDDAVRALRDVLRLPAGGMAVPQGQADNGNVFAMLVRASQQEYNRDRDEVGRDAAEVAQIGALAAQLDPDKLAAAVVAKLPPATAGGLTADQVKDAVKAAAREGTG